MSQPAIPGLPEATASPRHYGFHATLRPPMRLATGWEAFVSSAHAVAAAQAPFALPTLAVADLSGFLALRETRSCPALHRLADACVQATDMHRLQPDAAELAMRRASGLSPDQDALLLRWGYPHVFESWRFHMTLSRRLSAAEMARFRPDAEAHFRHALAQPRLVRAIAIFTQRDGGPFLMAERLPLAG